MTTQQLAVLNALVTYAVENIPGGPSPSELVVAKIVGRLTLDNGTMDNDLEARGSKEYNYKIINPTHHPSIETALNAWAEMGWRVVGTVPGSIAGRTSPKVLYGVILERPVGVTHPDDEHS
jgi:hypothetical protein